MKNDEMKFKPISDTEIMTDAMLDEIEAGSCSSCTKACQPGNQNAGNGNEIDIDPSIP